MNPTSRPTLSWQRHIAAAFTKNLGLKASAVLLTIVLWILVGAREPIEEVANVRFAPLLDSALVMRDPPPPIRALVLGRASEILKLSNTPLVIRRQIASDVPDTVVVPLRTADVEVPEGVGVIVRDVQPHSLTLRFERIATRVLPVRSALRVFMPAGTSRVAVRFDPDVVTVSGPRLTVARLRWIPTVADSIAMDTLPHLIDLDTTGLGVTVRPVQVKALLARAQQ